MALVPDHAAGGVQPQPLEIPEALVPEIEALPVAVHLALDDLDVGQGSLPGGRLEVGYVFPYPGEDSPFELEEIGIDAHPVARVFPALGLEVLSLEWPGRPFPLREPSFRRRFLNLPPFPLPHPKSPARPPAPPPPDCPAPLS